MQQGRVQVPLFDVSAGAPAYPDNAEFLKEHVAGLLLLSFPNLTMAQVVAFVLGLFDVSKDLNAFKVLLRDFLIAVKEFESEDNSELYAEEVAASLELNQRENYEYRASVPGLLNPHELGEEPELADF